MKNLVLLSLACAASLSWADSVNVSLTSRAMKGKGAPAVHLEILEPIAGFRPTLARDGGKAQEWKGGGRPGVTRTIELPHPDGVARWAGELVVNLPNGTTASMPLEFQTEVVGPLNLTIDKANDFDPLGRSVRFSANQPVVKVHLKVTMDSGAVAFDDDLAVAEEPAGTKVQLAWPEAKGLLFKLEVRAWAKSGVYNGFELMPWRVDIPHEEVNFASGKSDVAAVEASKLEASLVLIQEAVARYGRMANLRLYVVGHTDSVGSSEANRTLSLNRARAIATYLKSRGLKISLFYEGFGEESPLVPTPDETAEPQNRRAEYIISLDDPTTRNVPFEPKWRRL